MSNTVAAYKPPSWGGADHTTSQAGAPRGICQPRSDGGDGAGDRRTLHHGVAHKPGGELALHVVQLQQAAVWGEQESSRFAGGWVRQQHRLQRAVPVQAVANEHASAACARLSHDGAGGEKHKWVTRPPAASFVFTVTLECFENDN